MCFWTEYVLFKSMYTLTISGQSLAQYTDYPTGYPPYTNVSIE